VSAFWNAQRTAHQDQCRAAEQESFRLVGHMAAMLNAPVIRAEERGAGRQVSQRWMSVVEALVFENKMHYCPHVLGGPVAAMVAFWKPNEMVCIACFAQAERLDEEADRTCDECGFVDPAGVYQQVVNFGMFTIVGGLCDACQARDKASLRD
jgi:hypothetical protein